MNIIQNNEIYRIYADGIKSYQQLPAKTYNICFNPRSGFYLEEIPNIEITEKIFGEHEKKLQKVMRSFDLFERNLGIILSGDKGIGKSLFAKMLAVEGVRRGYPVLIVPFYVEGISSFINSIEQEVFVLFDEFDKTFCGKSEDRDSALDPQTEMLTLFDGLSQGKKMFIITCNNVNKINNYLVNRPGRFHYHLRFEYPNAAAIREFLEDKEVSDEDITKVVNFSTKVLLNYDCLRAIADELKVCDSFEEAITDLNIVDANGYGEDYNLIIHFADGTTVRRSARLSLFDDEEKCYSFETPGLYENCGCIRFTPSEALFNGNTYTYYFDKTNSVWENYLEDAKEDDYTSTDWSKVLAWKGKEFVSMSVHRSFKKTNLV